MATDKAKASEEDGPRRQTPPEASFRLLVAGFAAQAQVALGLHENPITHKTEKDLAMAKHAIATLEILETKTKGNLDAEEASFLSQVLYGLRMAFVRLGK